MMRRLTKLHKDQEADRVKMRKRMLAEAKATATQRFEDKLRALEAISDEEWQAAVDADEAEASTNAA